MGTRAPPPPHLTPPLPHLESSRVSVVFTADILALRCLEVFLVSSLLIVSRPWYSVPSFSWGKTVKSSRLTLLCSLILSRGKRVTQSLTTHGKIVQLLLAGFCYSLQGCSASSPRSRHVIVCKLQTMPPKNSLHSSVLISIFLLEMRGMVKVREQRVFSP